MADCWKEMEETRIIGERAWEGDEVYAEGALEGPESRVYGEGGVRGAR